MRAVRERPPAGPRTGRCAPTASYCTVPGSTQNAIRFEAVGGDDSNFSEILKWGGIWLAGSYLGTAGAIVLLVRGFVRGQDLARRFCLRNRGSGVLLFPG